MLNKKIGKLGETIAAEFLKRKKYTLIEKNFQLPAGEVDLIFKKGRLLIFVEVKTRTSIRFGQPEEAINEAKLAKLESLAEFYCHQTNHQGAWKIEVVSILINYQKKGIGIKHLTEL